LLDAGVGVEDAAKIYNPGQLPSEQGICWRPLHIATAFHLADIVELLVRHGTDVNALSLRDGLEQTALQSAARHSYVDIAQILVDRGAKIANIPCPFWLDDILNYEGHEDLWDRLRVGITVERSIQIEC
jgi:lambda repressor-like predicted transcriptional regulator